ncbi:MAG TPA: hypothetical protein PK765_07335 [bacterium]|nr:hypothetical protein [bacterium]
MEQLGIDIALAIDPEKFRRSMDGRKLSELERASVDNLGAIQALLRDTPGATELIRE